MKKSVSYLVASLFLLSASSSFAASVCKVSGNAGGYTLDGKAHVYVECNAKNPDANEIVYGDAFMSNTRILTVVAKLLDKGYKIVTEVSEESGESSYTVAK
jgi:hypothetical protein